MLYSPYEELKLIYLERTIENLFNMLYSTYEELKQDLLNKTRLYVRLLDLTYEELKRADFLQRDQTLGYWGSPYL